MVDKPTYNISASIASLLIPLALLLWVAITSTSPDGTPDNGPIRALPAIFILGTIVFLSQLVTYYFIGKKQYTFTKPKIKTSLMLAIPMSLPLPIIIFFLATSNNQKTPTPILESFGYSLIYFGVIFLCFMTGAITQFLLINKRHNKLLKHR